MYLGVDVGGTKTLVVVFGANGEIKKSLKFPTPEKYEDFLTVLLKSTESLAISDIKAACIAMPGRIDRKAGAITAFGNRPWRDIPVQADTEKILNCPILLENDAKLAGLSEAQYIKDEFKKVLYITISTGIGGGLIVNGKIDPQFADIEVGQLLLEHEGRLMDWEDFASGRAFNQRFGKKVSEIDANDKEAWYWIARQLAIGLIDLIVTLTPEVIVIGGGVGSHFDKFGERLVEELKIYENPLVPLPVIMPAKYPEEAVIRGCYVLLREHYGSR